MKKRYNYLFLFSGIILLTLVITHIASFTPHDYFYKQHPDIAKYIGTNVVSMWADFSFFTYHTMIFSGVWLILLVIGEWTNNKYLKCFTRNQSVMAFIMTNYILTVILYTIFELSSGQPTFGWYGNNNSSIHNLGTNILSHYVCFCLVLFAYIKVTPLSTFKKRHIIYILLYAVSYYTIVKLTGKYAYRIEWYPYPIFDEYWIMNILGITSKLWGVVILTIILAIILSGYYLIFWMLVRKKKM